MSGEESEPLFDAWKDYYEFFGVIDQRTAANRLIALGFKMPKKGAPNIWRSTLLARIDAVAQKNKPQITPRLMPIKLF